jgi:hypothetical protein
MRLSHLFMSKRSASITSVYFDNATTRLKFIEMLQESVSAVSLFFFIIAPCSNVEAQNKRVSSYWRGKVWYINCDEAGKAITITGNFLVNTQPILGHLRNTMKSPNVCCHST